MCSKRSAGIRWAGSAVAFCLLLGAMIPAPGPVHAQETSAAPAAEDTAADAAVQTDSSYYAYYMAHQDENRPQQRITAVYMPGELPAATAEIDGRQGIVLDEESGGSDWTVDVPESGLYSLYITYCPLEGTGKDIECGVQWDGTYVYADAASLTLPRMWTDKPSGEGSPICQDADGNDLRPEQVEKAGWYEQPFADVQGMYQEPYLFYLEAGSHVLHLTVGRESMAVAAVHLANEAQPCTYAAYRERHRDAPQASGEVIRLEAETPYVKSSSMLYAVSDRSNVNTLPNDPYNIRLNTIGQSNWGQVGQSITWKANVPQSGWYKLAFRARQNYNQGMISYRTLYINGEIPFQEAENIAFAYESGWTVRTVGDEEPLLVYLEPGDEITLTCSPGPMSSALRDINQAVLGLNAIYRKIIVITGANPDIYRDYALEREIPGLTGLLETERDRLYSIAETIVAATGESSSQTAALQQTAAMLDDFIRNTYSITERLTNFKSEIENISSLLLSFGQQPLELDCLYFIPPDKPVPEANASFFRNVGFEIQKFLASFVNDYNAMSMGERAADTIQVWVTTGRDQMQVLNRLIEDSFSTQSDTRVSLSLVDTGTTLIQATLAGQGPDAALMVATDQVINFAMRGALADLSAPAYDIAPLADQFYESAWTPFYFEDGLYALPETQTFNMLFYRTDIFEEFHLEPPATWQDFYDILQVLQNNNLVVGINETDEANPGVSASISTFDSFLFQRGGTYYNDTFTATQFDTTAAYEAFEEWAALYAEYKLPRSVNFFNRFRTGEMPMGIAAYTMYNQLMASAPELRGLWKMAAIPGTPQPDGTVNRATSSSGTGAMMMKSAEDRGVGEQVFAFLSWWVQADAQTRYGRELEAVLGIAARYNPANRQAFNALGWDEEELTALQEQWEWVQNVRQIPGNYMLSRALTNALRSVLDYGREPRRELFLYNKDINAEITRKRAEFKLDEKEAG